MTTREPMVQVVINEQHKLVKNQEDLLNEKFGSSWQLFHIPISGWDLEQLHGVLKMLKGDPVVFASPVPFLLKELSAIQPDDTYIFYNDNRNQKNINNGKVTYSVAKTGWQII